MEIDYLLSLIITEKLIFSPKISTQTFKIWKKIGVAVQENLKRTELRKCSSRKKNVTKTSIWPTSSFFHCHESVLDATWVKQARLSRL